MGCLHRQEEFVGLGMVLTQDQLERELREDKGIQILLKTPGNELTNPISQNDFKTPLPFQYFVYPPFP